MRILIIEDDQALGASLQYQLEQTGYTADVCYDGEDGLYYIREGAADLILLDRMLPGMDGIEILKTIRKEQILTPVILVTALGELSDKITGLDEGADDYLVKPYAFEELLARIRCIQRRPRTWEEPQLLTLSPLVLDPVKKLLTNGSLCCTLSKKEGDLLEVFLRNPGQILPRMTLILKVWGPDAEVEEGNLDNYIHFLRRRLKSLKSPYELKTVRGIGYLLEACHV